MGAHLMSPAPVLRAAASRTAPALRGGAGGPAGVVMRVVGISNCCEQLEPRASSARAVRRRGLSFVRFLALVLFAASLVSNAAAQDPQQTVENLNRDAMEAYNALDIEKARGMLEQAVQTAMQAGIGGPLLARTQL